MKINKFVKYLIGFTIIICVYVLILILSCTIPFEGIYDNINDSYAILQKEGLYPHPAFKAGMLDNWSDSLLFNIAATQKNEDLFVSAMSNNRVSSQNGAIDEITCMGIACERDHDKPIEDYSRYWLGIVCIIKFFSLFLDLGRIRYVILMVYIFLQAFLLVKIRDEIKMENSMAYLVATCIVPTFYHVMCLSFSTDIIIMQIFMLIICYLYKSSFWQNNRRFIYFLVGSITFYANFLSAPLYTLAFPLILELQLICEKKLKKVIDGAIMWLGGYSVTVLIKQILSKIVLGQESGIDQIRLWSGVEDSMNTFQRWKIVINRFSDVFNYTNMIVLVAIIIVIVLVNVAKKKIIELPKFEELCAYLFLGLLPFIWLFVFAKHAGHGFDSMYFAITIYVFMVLLVNLFCINEKVIGQIDIQK